METSKTVFQTEDYEIKNYKKKAKNRVKNGNSVETTFSRQSTQIISENKNLCRVPNITRLSVDYIEVFDVHLHKEKIIKFKENEKVR